jgi:hypothetical protein
VTACSPLAFTDGLTLAFSRAGRNSSASRFPIRHAARVGCSGLLASELFQFASTASTANSMSPSAGTQATTAHVRGPVSAIGATARKPSRATPAAECHAR